MDLPDLLRDPARPVLLYGTTPPRADAPPERVLTAARRLAERVAPLPLDGLVVYDIQDESARIADPRPFPFLPTLDPRLYASLLRDLTGREVIAYKSIGAMPERAWGRWLSETRRDYGLRCLSLVGLPSARGAHSPMSVAQAARLAAAHPAGFTLGGVVIAERHAPGRSESRRLIAKAEAGCAYFISQAVYHAATTIGLLRDYAADCRAAGGAPRRIVLTFVPCGRERTLAFLRWLGIAIDDDTAAAILTDPAPLTRSIAICRANLRAILDATAGLGIPLGLNIESVSIHRDEIEASVDLAHALRAEWPTS